MCLLPVSGSKTLVYGSGDAGNTIHAGEKVEGLSKIMKDIAQELNIKEHRVQQGGDGTIKSIHTAVDIEVHEGNDSEKRLYALDFARLMPPESPSRKPG
jgi:hypothetical protein